MKKIVLVYGGIAGLIVLPMLILLVTAGEGLQNAASGMVVGFASMLLAFSMIFFGTRSYRNNYLGGRISFGRAFATGTLIALLASTIYVVAWVVLSKAFYPEFADDYARISIEKLKESGLSGEDLDRKIRSVEKDMAFYKTWPGLILYTYAEILWIGIPIALLSALILSWKRKKTALPEV